MHILKLTLFFLLFTSLKAGSNTETIGDIFRIILPIGTYSTTLYLDDSKGEMEFYKSFGSTVAATYLLKYTVQRERPNGEDTHSFPSGHSSSTFSSASFIHIRYGFKYAILPYIAASYTAYSRVESQQHYLSDVVAGAVIGVVSSWYFTSSYESENIALQPLNQEGYSGVVISYKW